MELNFEAWQGQSEPYEIASPLFTSTYTIILFVVLDSDRNAVDLTGYAAKFAGKSVEETDTLFDILCVDNGLASGKLKAVLNPADIPNAAECTGELRLFSDGDVNGDVTDRIQFRFDIISGIG